MTHFIMDCTELEEDRNYDLIKESNESSQDRMVDLLFRSDNFQGVGNMIKKMWQRRRRLLSYIKEVEENRKKSKKNKNKKPPSPEVYQKSDPGPVRRGHDHPEGRSLKTLRIRG